MEIMNRKEGLPAKIKMNGSRAAGVCIEAEINLNLLISLLNFMLFKPPLQPWTLQIEALKALNTLRKCRGSIH